MQMTQQRIGEGTLVLEDGTIRADFPLDMNDLASNHSGVIPWQSAPMDPAEAERIGSELLFAARRARQIRGQSR